MTDGQLIVLLEETPADEFSFEQIALLRRRLPHSPELREALAGQLRLEQALNAALGTPRVSIDAIFAHAAASPAGTAGVGRLFGWGSVTALVIAVTTVGVLLQRPWAAAPNAPPARRVAAANEDDAVVRPAAEPELAAPQDQQDPVARAVVADATPTLKPTELPEITSPSDSFALLAADRVADRAVMQEPEMPPQQFPDVQSPPDSDQVETAFFQELEWPGFEPLERRLEAIEGAHERLVESDSQGPLLKLAALSQLREAWPEAAALRLRLGKAPRFRLHLWNGAQGLTLERHELPQPAWAIYRATRRADDARPQSLALWATDSDRYRRAGAGTVDLRWQAGEFVLSRGDVPLAVVPCPTRPETIFLEGPAELHGLAFVPCETLPLYTAPAEAAEAAAPAKLTWTSHLPPGAEWNTLAEGRCELLAEDTAELSWVATRIADPGLHELIFQLEDPLPGTGVYLGDDAGRPLYQLGFFRDDASGQTCFGFAAPGDPRTQTDVDRSSIDHSRGPAPFADVRPWLRLSLGSGRLRCWTSGDGRHWSPALEPLGGLGAGYSTVGLYALPGGGTRCLRIRRFEARELTTLASLAAPALRAQVSGMSDALTAATWPESIRRSRPAGIAADHWRLACAVELLAAGSRPELTSPVLLDLLKQTLEDERLAAAERLALLDEAALLFDASDAARQQAFLAAYERLAHAFAREGKTKPFSRVRRALLTSPLCMPVAFDALPAALVGPELAELSAAGDEQAVRALCARLEFFCGRGHAEVRRLLTEALDRLSSRPTP
ncbi:MAG TPA: hypothetical protein VMV10_16675 [Pirellulales bacterium]|nr:hypothetical protein [Pirellulales bacterium]